MRPITLALTACLLAAGCSAPEFRIQPRYVQLDIDGELGADVSGATITPTKLSDLGLSEEGVGALRGDFRWGGSNISASYMPTEFKGTGQLTGDITIDGETISAGSSVATDIEYNVGNAVYTFDFFPTRKLDLGIGVGVALLDFKMRMQEQGGSMTTVTTDESVPIPLLAGRVGSEIGRFRAVGDIGGMKISTGDVDVTYLDADAQLGFCLLGGKAASGWLTVGYRYVGIDGDYDDGSSGVRLDLRVAGPYIGAEFAF